MSPCGPFEEETVGNRALQLAVFVNDKSVDLIVAAVATPEGDLLIRRGDLEEAGVKVPGVGTPNERVSLSGAGLPFRYDEPGQELYFALTNDQRIAKVYNQHASVAVSKQASPSYGGLLNYRLFASSSTSLVQWQPMPAALSATFDARLFTPVFVATQSLIAGNTPRYETSDFERGSGVRLDTTITHADLENAIIYRAGDLISGGMAWTRPIRLGGLQAQRNFDMRPDLVTTPMPSISGSAAVPSTVDVFVNGSKTYSQQVGEGPFSITNLPLTSSAGAAEVVIRDVTGRETKQSLPLFSGQHLLAPGMTDFALEIGAARRFYGMHSFDYDRNIAGSGSIRFGLSERMTVNAHIEGAPQLANASGGLAASLGHFGNVEFAGGGSWHSGPSLQNEGRSGTSIGGLGYAGYSLATSWGIGFNFSAHHIFGRYEDLASTTAPVVADNSAPLNPELGIAPIMAPGAFTGVDLYAPRASYRAAITTPVPSAGGHVSLSGSWVQRDVHGQVNGTRNSRLVTLTYSRELPLRGHFFVTSYADFSASNPAFQEFTTPNNQNIGFFTGVSFPIGETMNAMMSTQRTSDPLSDRADFGGNAQIQQSVGNGVGAYSWSLNSSQGQKATHNVTASYNTSVGNLHVSGLQQDKNAGGTVEFSGAIGMADMLIAAGPPVYDSFAVVKAGAPDVAVLHDNRRIGYTNLSGRLLVPTLRAYQPNKVAIDPSSLPDNAIAGVTEKLATPAYRSGVGIDFAVETDVKSVVLILTDKNGKFIEPGNHGRIEDGESFIVGYDGRAYLRHVHNQNTAIVDLGDHDCRATFAYQNAIEINTEVRASCE